MSSAFVHDSRLVSHMILTSMQQETKTRVHCDDVSCLCVILALLELTDSLCKRDALIHLSLGVCAIDPMTAATATDTTATGFTLIIIVTQSLSQQRVQMWKV